jgi:Big-like domain-containing protein
MFDAHDPDLATAGGHRPGATPTRARKPAVVITFAVIIAVIVASQTVLASPGSAVGTSSAGHHRASRAALVPPAGTTWIEGVITDQANHPQDNVNVEAWPREPAATEPAASSLTYGGPPDNAAILHGFFLLQVPNDQAYRIVFSAVGGQEDGDAFRMKAYGHGRPIAVRNLAPPAGRIRDLGTIALARHGHVASRTKAHLAKAKVAAGKRATLRIKVTSKLVSNVTGKVVVRVAGKKVTHRLTATSHGKASIKLPRVRKAGVHRVHVTYAGSKTVHRSKAKPVKLKIRK